MVFGVLSATVAPIHRCAQYAAWRPYSTINKVSFSSLFFAVTGTINGHRFQVMLEPDGKKRLPMYSHTFISVTDFPRALKFYNALMTELALEQKFVDAT